MDERACMDCAAIFPATDENFRRTKGGALSRRCRACSKARKESKKKKELATKKSRSLDDIEKAARDTFLAMAAQGGANIPHTSEVLERLMEYFGGSSGFAAVVAKQYWDSPAGGSSRTKTLEMMMRLAVKNTELGGAKKPLGQWSDEELEKELFKRLKNLMHGRRRVIDVQVEPPQTPSDFAAAFAEQPRLAPAAGVEGDSGGDSGEELRGVGPVQADPEAGVVPPVPVE